MLYAYAEKYLAGAQRMLGDMLYFAVNCCNMEAERFWEMFLISDVAAQYQRGDPVCLAEMNGVEFAMTVLEESGWGMGEIENRCLGVIREDPGWVSDHTKTPAYWAGCALSYYHWQSSRSFQLISDAVPIVEVLAMHEGMKGKDLSLFVQAVDERWDSYYKETRLRSFRKQAGMTQRQLADQSDVPIRVIQLIEQRQRNINRSGALSVWKLARALGCRSEDLLEI